MEPKGHYLILYEGILPPGYTGNVALLVIPPHKLTGEPSKLKLYNILFSLWYILINSQEAPRQGYSSMDQFSAAPSNGKLVWGSHIGTT